MSNTPTHSYLTSTKTQQTDLKTPSESLRVYENKLRPKGLEHFYGQESLKKNLRILISAAKKRQEPLGHVLFSGPPGLGKTTLASIIASEMGVDLKMTSGPVLEKAADLAGVLSNLNEGSVLFIDEIHRLKMNVEEYLYPAMEDFKLDLMVDTGASARSLQINLNRFTLIAATTRQGSLSRPLRSRFTTNFRMDFYEDHVLAFIIKRSANMLGFELSSTAAEAIAKRSRGTPRVANNLLKWVRDYVDAQGLVSANESVALTALGMLDIDEIGLDEMDRRLLKILIEQYDGGPVGINTLALTLGEEPSTIEEVHEPFLILKGLLNRTPRGRVVSPLAYKHLNMNNNTNNETSPS